MDTLFDDLKQGLEEAILECKREQTIEKIFAQIPELCEVKLDKILFEGQYPVMFTCRDTKNVYLFLCCQVNAVCTEWIGTITTYDNLIALLENKISIRAAFLNVTEGELPHTVKVCGFY